MPTPESSTELVELIRNALRKVIGEPVEYEIGRFACKIDGVEVAVLATERTFPAIQFQHLVVEVSSEGRQEAIEFANALHGRSSTLGSYWWLGNDHLWQAGVLWATKFDEEIFVDHLWTFVHVAKERTPEIRSRLSGELDEDGPSVPGR